MRRVASDLGVHEETLRLWVRQADIDRWLEALAVSNTKMLAKIKERIGQGVIRNGLYS